MKNYEKLKIKAYVNMLCERGSISKEALAELKNCKELKTK